jgi:hypothetical protein
VVKQALVLLRYSESIEMGPHSKKEKKMSRLEDLFILFCLVIAGFAQPAGVQAGWEGFILHYDGTVGLR